MVIPHLSKLHTLMQDASMIEQDSTVECKTRTAHGPLVPVEADSVQGERTRGSTSRAREEAPYAFRDALTALRIRRSLRQLGKPPQDSASDTGAVHGGTEGASERCAP